MLAVGLHDGNIAVYNLQKKGGHPVYQSDPRNGKHKDVVWQVTSNWTYNLQKNISSGEVGSG